MVVTIDGPAGAGKSSVARRLAERLGFQFLDTGAMYRAVTLAALRRGVDLQDRDAVARLASRVRIDLDGQTVRLDGEDVSREIRTAELAQQVKPVADNPEVRRLLVQRQRELARGRDTVTEGRDQGTLAFPDAECKIFLTASLEERARRRWRELLQRGTEPNVSYEMIVEQLRQRDEQDRKRPVGALKPADDAVRVDTDGLSLEEVVDRLEAIVRRRIAELQS